jgi:RNA recognition motif-containing protein
MQEVGRQVIVKGFSQKTLETELKDHFSSSGQVDSVAIVRDVVTGMSRGYAFITFKDEESAFNAYKVSHTPLI